MDEQGIENAAILLMSLGEEHASEVFKHLAPKEVQRMGETIAKLKSVSRDRLDQVLDQFRKIAGDQSMLVEDNDEYVRAVLKRALGEDKANLLLDRILQGNDVSGIESLKWMEPSAVAELMRHEHPQIVAAILVHLEFDHAAEVLKLFSERQRNEVLVRVATLDGIQPSAMRDLNEVLNNVLAGSDRVKKTHLGGVKPAAEIINMLGASLETAVLDYIRGADNDLAQRILDNMFTFDDLERLDDKGIQSLMKEVQSESLVDRAEGRHARAAREDLQEHVHARCRDAARGPGIARPGARGRGRGRAEGAAEDRASPVRRRRDRDRGRR